MQFDSESKEEARIAALYATGLLDSPPSPAVNELVAGLTKHYGTKTAWVSLIDRRHTRLFSTCGIDSKAEDYEESHAPWLGTALLGRKLPVIVGDCRQHTAFKNSPYVLSGEVVFMAFIQLTTKEGHTIGAVGIDDPEPRDDFTLQDADHLVSSVRELTSLLGI
jgi:hypothetical protein